MLRIMFFMILFFMLALLAACTPTGESVEITPQPTTPVPTTVPEPTEAPTQAPTAPVEATAEPTIATPDSVEAFTTTLMEAISARDFTTLQTLMADPFSVGYWLSEGVSYSPGEAVAFLESNLLPEGAQIVWADPATDLAPMLQGQPPESFLGPDKRVAAALLSYGWGEDGSAETIQFISQQPDGTYRWELLLLSAFGFMGLPTDVEAVVITADEARFFAGPGETYESVATVFGGMTYPVIGVSQDQQWWRLRCYDDNNALIPQCWVTADPAVTSPSTLP